MFYSWGHADYPSETCKPHRNSNDFFLPRTWAVALRNGISSALIEDPAESEMEQLRGISGEFRGDAAVQQRAPATPDSSGGPLRRNVALRECLHLQVVGPGTKHDPLLALPCCSERLVQSPDRCLPALQLFAAVFQVAVHLLHSDCPMLGRNGNRLRYHSHCSPAWLFLMALGNCSAHPPARRNTLVLAH